MSALPRIEPSVHGEAVPATDGEAEFYIQWKGTDVCFDFTCSCGCVGHFDGFFASAVKCPECGGLYEMPSTITLPRLTATSYAWDPVVPFDPA